LKLALFDLDNTLIAGDSDYLWGEFLCEHDYVDPNAYHAGHDKYYQEYLEGILDINEFLQFQLGPMAGKSPQQLQDWQDNYIELKIRPILLDRAIDLIDQHRKQDHIPIIITATNRFLTEPITAMFDVENLIASEAEMVDGVFTGKPTGIPSYREGKIKRLKAWLNDKNMVPEESWFYSDSHNDIPLLEYVDHATAVDPDDHLRTIAEQRGWPIISLR